MRLPSTLAAAAIGLTMISAAATAATPVRVTRFHLGVPITRGPIAVEPLAGAGPASLEYKTYAAAVQTELLNNGFTAPAESSAAPYLATVSFSRVARDLTAPRAPVTIGLGGGTGSGGFGVGGGVSFGVGKKRTRTILVTEISVQIRQRDGGAIIWEGRAQTEAIESAKTADANATAGKLAHALFRGFPGESGRTITVK